MVVEVEGHSMPLEAVLGGPVRLQLSGRLLACFEGPSARDVYCSSTLRTYLEAALRRSLT